MKHYNQSMGSPIFDLHTGKDVSRLALLQQEEQRNQQQDPGVASRPRICFDESQLLAAIMNKVGGNNNG